MLALCKYLKLHNWAFDDIEINKLFSGTYETNIEEETYDKLMLHITDNPSRDLLYRLKLIIGLIKSEHIDLVTGTPPNIEFPYEKLTKLSGKWVVRLKNGAFQLSPLVKKLSNNNLTPSLRQSINEALGQQILQIGRIDPIDAHKALLYFCRSGNYDLAGFVLILVLEKAIEIPDSFEELPFLLFWVNSPIPVKMDSHLKAVIRTFQIKLIERRGDWVNKLYLEFLMTDLEEIVKKSLIKSIDVSYASLFLAFQYSGLDPIKSNEYLILALKHIDRINNADINAFTKTDRFSIEGIVWKSLILINSAEQFQNWLNGFQALSSEQKAKSLIGEMHLICIQIFFRKIYEHELSKSKTEWTEFIEFIQQILYKAQDDYLITISACCIKYKTKILVEKLENITSAIELVEQFISLKDLNDIDKFMVLDELGQQLFYNGNKNKSINYLKIAAELEVPSFFTEKAECYLILNQLYDELDKSIANKYVSLAYKYQNENSFISETFSFKIIGEYALSLFEKGDTTKGFYIFEKGLYKILYSYKPIEDYQAIIIRYSHVLNYYYHKLNNKQLPRPNGEEYVKPFRGIFLRSNNALLESGFYFEQRKFMVAFLMVDIFESIGDFQSASNWFDECVRLNSDDDENAFVVLMQGMQTYLILQNKFEEAASWMVKILDQISNLKPTSQMFRFEINERTQEDIFSKFESSKKENDIFLYEFVLVYSSIKILWDYIKTTDELQIKKSISNLGALGQYFSNTSKYVNVHFLIIQLADFLLDKKKSVDDILGLIHTSQNDSWLQIIVYLFASIKSDAKEALDLHFALIKYLTQLASKLPNKSVNYFLITPFFVDFWKYKLQYRNCDFVFTKHLIENGFPSIDSSKIQTRLKKLYRVICYHLEYEVGEELSVWLSSD